MIRCHECVFWLPDPRHHKTKYPPDDQGCHGNRLHVFEDTRTVIVEGGKRGEGVWHLQTHRLFFSDCIQVLGLKFSCGLSQFA